MMRLRFAIILTKPSLMMKYLTILALLEIPWCWNDYMNSYAEKVPERMRFEKKKGVWNICGFSSRQDHKFILVYTWRPPYKSTI